MRIAKIFDVAANDYDATRRKYISCFDDFYGVAIEQIPFKADEHFSVLDLGAGTGLFSEMVRSLYPNVTLTLTDISPEMLGKARERFKGTTGIHYLNHDYIAQPIDGEYDVVISALSLHHSTETQLDQVFSRVYSCLKPGGIFINADQILGRTPRIEQMYEQAWLEQAESSGCTPEEIKVAMKRMESDKTLPLTLQLDLLEKTGFSTVNCWYQYYRYAVYSGVKTA